MGTSAEIELSETAENFLHLKHRFVLPLHRRDQAYIWSSIFLLWKVNFLLNYLLDFFSLCPNWIFINHSKVYYSSLGFRCLCWYLKNKKDAFLCMYVWFSEFPKLFLKKASGCIFSIQVPINSCLLQETCSIFRYLSLFTYIEDLIHRKR